MPKKGCCVIPHCRNSNEKTSDPDAIYQKFPSKDKTRRRWIKAIQVTFSMKSLIITSSSRLCSDHFQDSSFVVGKNGKRIFKLDAVPTIFTTNTPKKQPPPPQPEVEVRPRHHSRRAASKEALKQMQILLEDENDTVEIPDDDDEVIQVPVTVAPPKKKYKLTHRKSSDGNDREVLVLKTITPNITNHYVENNLELECWIEELEPCQKERNKKLEEEDKALQLKLDELIKACQGEVVFKGDLTTAIEVSEHIQKTIQAVQASHKKPPIVLNSTVANAQPYQLVMDPRLGLVVGTVPPNTQTPTKQGKIQVATNLQAPITPNNQGRGRPRNKKQTPVAQQAPPPLPPAPVTTRSLVNNKQYKRKTTSTPPPAPPPATRSRGNEPAPRPIVATPPSTRSRNEPTPQPAPAIAPAPTTRSRDRQTPASTPTTTTPVARTRPAAITGNVRPTESNVEGGLTTGTNAKSKAIVDLTTDDGRPLPDSREVSFNKLQGKTFPSLVVVARPHLRVADVNSDRARLDLKVKAVLMYAPTKFTEWLIQQGLVKSEQKCSVHNTTQLKLGMYSDVSKFPYSGGYVWISECCPQRFVSVFSGSLFEGSPHPPLVILKTLYHWSCQTNIQNVVQWVKVDNLYVKGMYTWLRAICSVALQTHVRQLGGTQMKVEVGVISLGTTSQDGNSRQVKVEVLGILETTTKLIRLRAIEPVPDGDRNYKKRFSKILEPLLTWVHPSSIIVTDLTVDKATLHQMGFPTVIQTTSIDANNSNRTIMEYLRRIVPRMFQNTLSLLSRQIIQQFLDELVWREWFGTTSMQAFDNIISHLAEQTRHESNMSLTVKLNRVALNPFKNWGIPATSATVVPPPTPSAPTPPVASTSATKTETSAAAAKKRKRKEPEPQPKAAPPAQPEVTRPPKSNSPDVPEQMVPLENYYYGTIDNYPPKTNVTLNLKCPFCKEVYNNNIVLMNHLFKHAHNVSKDGQMCRYCLTSVPTANDLLKHIATAHPSETKHDNGFVCLICETQYMNPFVLGKHMSKEHCPSELPYQCGTCGYICSNHKQAIDHFYKQHDNGPTIQCPFCLKSTTVFSSSRNIAQNMHYFIQHLQKHQRKQYAKRCGKCNLWFVQKEVLKEHQTKMHASQRGKTGLVPWIAPRNGVMVPKSKMDKYPCDAEGINFTTLFYNVSKGLKCKECDGPMDSTKHFPSFESCQNPNCQYSTCCSNAMQEHNAKCNKNSQHIIPVEPLPCNMFCICGYSSQDGNQMAKHLAICEKKSAYPSLSDAKSASVTHSMLDVLGLVRKPEEADKKVTGPSRTVKKRVTKSEVETITLDEDEPLISNIKTEKTKKRKAVAIDSKSIIDTKLITELKDEIKTSEGPALKKIKSDEPISELIDENESITDTNITVGIEKEALTETILDNNEDEVTVANDLNDKVTEKTDEDNEGEKVTEKNKDNEEGKVTEIEDSENDKETEKEVEDSELVSLNNTTNKETENNIVEQECTEELKNNEEVCDVGKTLDNDSDTEDCNDKAIIDTTALMTEIPSSIELPTTLNVEPPNKTNTSEEQNIADPVIPSTSNVEEFETLNAETEPLSEESSSKQEEETNPEKEVGIETNSEVTPESECVGTNDPDFEKMDNKNDDTKIYDPEIEEVTSQNDDADICKAQLDESDSVVPCDTEPKKNNDLDIEEVVDKHDNTEVCNIQPCESDSVVTPEADTEKQRAVEEGENIMEHEEHGFKSDIFPQISEQVHNEPEGASDVLDDTEANIENKPDGINTKDDLEDEVLAETEDIASSQENTEERNYMPEREEIETKIDENIENLAIDTLESINEKNDDTVQLFDDASVVSNLIDTVQSIDQSVSDQVFTDSTNVDIKDPAETSESLPSALSETVETAYESGESSNTQNRSEPMDYEDISNSGLDALSAMETN